MKTPKKDRELSKKTQKIITKKCSDTALSSSPEDDVALEDSQLSENHQLDLSPESAIRARESTDLTPSSVTKHVIGDNSSLHNSYVETAKSTDMVETEMLVNNLKQAKTQVQNATGIDLLSKKLLAKLVDVVVEDYIGGLSYENDQSEKFLAMKLRALILSFLLVFLGVVLLFFVYSKKQISYNGTPPT